MASAAAKAAVYGALVGDAFALGGHWIYDVAELGRKLPVPLDGYLDPLTNYHPGKKAGDFTHLADQVVWLLEEVVSEGKYDTASFRKRWHRCMTDGTFKGYVDGATKGTLAHLEAGSLEASTSNELSPVGRAAPLSLLGIRGTDFQAAVLSAVTMTHETPEVRSAAIFFSQVLDCVIGGLDPRAAIEKCAQQSDDEYVKDAVRRGVATCDTDTVEAVGELGRTCLVKHALPSCVHLLVKYPGDFMGAMRNNVAAGGDSAARGLVIGMVLAAHGGIDAIPAPLITGLSAAPKLKQLLGA